MRGERAERNLLQMLIADPVGLWVLCRIAERTRDTTDPETYFSVVSYFLP